MRSHLTRQIFRRMIANQPIHHRACLRRRISSISKTHTRASDVYTACHGLCTISAPQRRSFFDLGVFGKRRGDRTELHADPGIDEMMELVKMQRMNARLPQQEDIVDALKRFFDHRKRTKQPLEDTQAQLALEALRYCAIDLQDPRDESAPRRESQVLQQVLRNAAIVLRVTESPCISHIQLAKLVMEMSSHAKGSLAPLKTYVWVLAAANQALEAQNVVTEYERRSTHGNQQAINTDDPDAEQNDELGDEEAPSPRAGHLSSLWAFVVLGFAKGESEQKLVDALNLMRSRGYRSHPLVPTAMLDFYLRGHNKEAVKVWIQESWRLYTERKTPENEVRAAAELQRVLQWCLAHDELQLGHELVLETMTENPPKPVWDAIFVWAVGTGKGADEIGRMFSVMESSNLDIVDESQWRLPDIRTINTLIEFATSKNDPYLAERFISLGQQREIQPDARTYQLQIEYRLKVNDIDGALIAYTGLQSMDLSSREDLPTVNKLIIALCNSGRHDFETIMGVTADLSDRRARFEPSTISALALLHLKRDETHDLVDLLNTHSRNYSSADRQAIRDAVVKLCLDSKTPVVRAWDGYTVLCSVFDEMPRPERTEFMIKFFRAQRPDMAVHVFNEMRRHSRENTMPTRETYAIAFQECARLQDIEILEVVHNQLKLDYNINTNTFLYNALMTSYTACDRARKALEFWDSIVASKEGPTYDSIHSALRACAKAAFGDIKADEIWQRLRKMDIDLDQSLWTSYIAALAGNGNNVKVFSSVSEAEKENHIEVDASFLANVLSAASGPAKQAEILSWIEDRYPETVVELKRPGIETKEDVSFAVEIDRTFTP